MLKTFPLQTEQFAGTYLPGDLAMLPVCSYAKQDRHI